MNKAVVFFAIFSAGYLCNDIMHNHKVNIFENVQAEVAGMDYYDLKGDYDFKKAVRRIVENCSVDGYVDDATVYSSISC